MSDVLDQARRRMVIVLMAIGVLATLVLAGAQWPSYWIWIAPEQTPMTWLQSVVLVVSAWTTLLAVVVLRFRGTARQNVRPWLVLSVGFGVLAIDERFALHERIRDNILAPRDIRIPLLSWIAPGDFLVLLIAVTGLALLPLVLRPFTVDPAARRLLLAGVVLAGLAVGTDSIDPATWSVAQERLQQSLEEVVELAAGLCLLGAVALRLLSYMASDPAAPQHVPQASGASLDAESSSAIVGAD